MAKRKGVSLSVGRGEKSKKGGLTAKGRAKYNRATGSKSVSFSGIVTGTSLSATTGDLETVSVSFITSGAITNAA